MSENNGRLEESLGIQGCMGPVGPSRRARTSIERCVRRARGTLHPAVPSLAQSQGWSQQSAGGVVFLEPRPRSILLCPVLPSHRAGASRALEVFLEPRPRSILLCPVLPSHRAGASRALEVSLEPRPRSILLCPVLPSHRAGASRALEVSLEPRPRSILLCPVLPSHRAGACIALEVSYLLSQDRAPSCCAQSCPVTGLEPAERWRCL